MKILIVLTSHDQLGNTGKTTGLWLEEFAAPYYLLKDAGASIKLASPKGGQPPLDPKSELPENQTHMTSRFGPTVLHRLSWRIRKSWFIFWQAILTRYFILAAMAQCGTCPITQHPLH